MKNNEILKNESLHELEVIRENDLEDLCNILRFSADPKKEASEKIKVILDLNKIIRLKESELIKNRINNGSNI